jgi:UDP-N-acetylmuramate--alanine ligase
MAMTQDPERSPFDDLRPGARIHLIGVAGAGMNALAAILVARGFSVSGSDQQRTAQVDRLVGQGLSFFVGHEASRVAGAGLVIISAAVQESNVELVAARATQTPVVKRAVALGWLLAAKRTIAVAGTHGKTTTSAMIAVILTAAGFDPTFVIGGEVLDLSASAAVGSGDWAVVEADEYDRSFLQLRPTIAVITNIEADHLEYFGSAAAMHVAFEQFVARTLPGGTLVINDQDYALRGVVAPPDVLVMRCAIDQEGVGWHASSIREDGRGSRFVITCPQGVHHARLLVPGRHNVLNALQALAAATAAGVDLSVALAALASFTGAGRRFEVIGDAAGVLVIDDYAHHPTEIRATLAAARARYAGRRTVIVFQPHTFSRTKLLFGDFVKAFDGVDLLMLTEIYAARETDSLGMSTECLEEAIAARLGRSKVMRVGNVDDVPGALAPRLTYGDVVLMMGAGTITGAGPRLIAALHATGKEENA